MEMKGEYRIPAPRERVWALLNSADVLRACIPGCDSLEGSPEDGFSARVTTKIGPVKATFAGGVTLSNVNPPESYTISGEGKGGVAGFAKGGADVHLAEDGADTILTYVARAQIGGKLAQLGSRLVDSTARKLADEFFTCFAARASEPVETLEPAVTVPEPVRPVVTETAPVSPAPAPAAPVEAAAPVRPPSAPAARPVHEAPDARARLLSGRLKAAGVAAALIVAAVVLVYLISG